MDKSEIMGCKTFEMFVCIDKTGLHTVQLKKIEVNQNDCNAIK